MTRFSIGNVIATAVKIWLRNLVPFVVVSVLVHLPLILWGFVIAQEHGREQLDQLRTLVIVGLYTSPVLDTAAAAAVSYGVIMELHGQRARLFDCVTTGFTRFFPALGAVIVAYFFAGLAYFAAALPVTCIGGLVDRSLTTYMNIGAITGAVFALVVYCRYYVATPAVVIERVGPLDAITRSVGLTGGHRTAIAGMLLLVIALGVGLVFANGVISRDRGVPLYLILELVRRMVASSLTAVIASVTYYLLRAEKEGTSAAELAAIFD